MTTKAKFVVGITDHMIGTPDLEAEVLGDDVEIDFFDSTDETQFAASRLERLDALMVWGARLGAQNIAHLKRCRGVVRYGVGYERSTSTPWQKPAFPSPTTGLRHGGSRRPRRGHDTVPAPAALGA